MSERFLDIIEAYEKGFKTHGDSPAALLGAKGRQHIRFQALTPLLAAEPVESLLDYGCGLAHLLPFLRSLKWSGAYRGVDIVESFVLHAQSQARDNARIEHITPASTLAGTYDVVFASGVFNLQTHETMEESKHYALERIRQLFDVANRFLVCDFMTDYVDFKQPGSQHWLPHELTDFSVKHLTRRFVVRHDLMPYEFTLILYKQADIQRPENVVRFRRAHLKHADLVTPFFQFLGRQRTSLERIRLTSEMLKIARRLKGRRAPVLGSGTPHFSSEAGMFLLTGTHRAIGRQFAEAFPLDTTLAAYDGIRRKEGAGELDRIERLLEGCAPEYLEFLRGIAGERGRYPFRTVLRAACCTVLDEQPIVNSCASVAFRERGRVVVGQNLDLGMNAVVALVCVAPDDGIPRLGVVTLGYPWVSSFVNASGLVAAGSSVNVNQPHRPSGDQLPQELLFDLLLSRAANVEEAAALLQALPPLGPLNGGVSAVLADSGGVIRQLEITGSACDISDDLDVGITTNHFRRPAMAHFNRGNDWMSARLQANSVARYDHAAGVTQGEAGRTPESVRSLLRTAGAQGAWLRKATWPDPGYTSVSYVIDLAAGEIEFWLGSRATQSSRASLAGCFGHARRGEPGGLTA